MLRCPFAQAGLLLFSSLLLALGLNVVRAEGLNLNWDYFMAEQNQGDSAFDSEFPLLDLEEAKTWWQYRADEPDGIYFVDARRGKTFAQGHIPEAISLDHWAERDSWPSGALDKLRQASKVILYCAGGECEDSLHLATELVYRHQVPPEIIAVFEGGFAEWQAAGLEVAQ